MSCRGVGSDLKYSKPLILHSVILLSLVMQYEHRDVAEKIRNLDYVNFVCNYRYL